MLRIIYKEKGFKLERIWFPKVQALRKSDADVLRFLRAKSEICENKKKKEPNYTIITNLEESEEQLKSHLKKTAKYEIGRAAQEDINIQIYDADLLKKDMHVMEEQFLVYKHFCKVSKQEELLKAYKHKEIQSYIENNCILVTNANFYNGKVFHTYVIDNENAVLVYSASDFRNENVDKALAGRANRFLHWKDMLELKKRGIKHYDWGNISSIDEPNGIDKFKLSFGGKIEIVYNFYEANSLKGKLLLLGKNIFQIIKGI